MTEEEEEEMAVVKAMPAWLKLVCAPVIICLFVIGLVIEIVVPEGGGA